MIYQISSCILQHDLATRSSLAHTAAPYAPAFRDARLPVQLLPRRTLMILKKSLRMESRTALFCGILKRNFCRFRLWSILQHRMAAWWPLITVASLNNFIFSCIMDNTVEPSSNHLRARRNACSVTTLSIGHLVDMCNASISS
jgi:hypothetical protein